MAAVMILWTLHGGQTPGRVRTQKSSKLILRAWSMASRITFGRIPIVGPSFSWVTVFTWPAFVIQSFPSPPTPFLTGTKIWKQPPPVLIAHGDHGPVGIPVSDIILHDDHGPFLPQAASGGRKVEEVDFSRRTLLAATALPSTSFFLPLGGPACRPEHCASGPDPLPCSRAPPGTLDTPPRDPDRRSPFPPRSGAAAPRRCGSRTASRGDRSPRCASHRGEGRPCVLFPFAPASWVSCRRSTGGSIDNFNIEARGPLGNVS